jgi:SAM-dependent methyltransferase
LVDPDYRVIVDATWGYRRLDPIPRTNDLSRFYESQYCDLLQRGSRAPDLRRLIHGGEDAAEEARWLRATIYEDIRDCLESNRGSVPRRLLDIGCGTGELLAFLASHGWQGVGLEPAAEIAEFAQARGLEVHASTLEEHLEAERRRPSALQYSAMTLLNVLEHLPDPVGLLNRIRETLPAGGLLAIRAPNDYNELQLSAQKALGKDPWWVAIPDHVNYFDFASLRQLLRRLGWTVVYEQADFPMELFLLLGEDYVGNPTTGKLCHEKRRQFELSINQATRRRWYRALAEAGLGRNCLFIAKRGPT